MSNKLYSVSYVTGGWNNMKAHTLLSLYTKEEAQKEVNALHKFGYPAHAIPCDSAINQKSFFCSSEILEDDFERMRHYKCYHKAFMGVNKI